MRKFIIILTLFFSSLALVSCQSKEEYDITTTMYPQYSLAKLIVKDKLNVKMIAPPGVDIHNYEMSSKDLITIDQSKLFFYNSDKVEPQIQNLNLKNVTIINIENYIDIDENNDHHNHGVHYWTSFENLIKMASIIYENIISKYDDTNKYYEQNYLELINVLNTYKEEYLSLVANSSVNKIFFAGHDAMHELSEEIGLDIVSLIDDVKPNLDITSKQIQNLVNKIIEHNAKVLYLPELESSQIATTIQRAVAKENIDLLILELHGFHNITKQQYKDDVSIIELIQQNFINLKRGLSHD